MMDKTEAIKDMAQTMCCYSNDVEHKDVCPDCYHEGDVCMCLAYAELLYNAGYRKVYDTGECGNG